MRGGTCFVAPSETKVNGASPRARGNPETWEAETVRWRRIPACAGEPSGGGAARSGEGAHPRVRGGTVRLEYWGELDGGASPRARGNPDKIEATINQGGRIPACAGEPPGL